MLKITHILVSHNRTIHSFINVICVQYHVSADKKVTVRKCCVCERSMKF